MFIKKIKPTTSSQRHLIRIINPSLNKKPLTKWNIKGKKNSSGRNNSGKITAFNRGGGHKRKYRIIEFKRDFNSEGIVSSIEYDPNRSANIASIFDFATKTYFYIIAPNNLSIGNIVKSGINAQVNLGHSLPVSKIPVGSFIHCVSLKTNQKARFSRSAGSYSKLIEKTHQYSRILLSSGQYKYISSNCVATLGIVSNGFKILAKLGKAGRSRWLNKRPKVRGVAMNPIDHPHGGGEGKTSGGRPSVTPWGKPTKGGYNRKKRN